MVIPASNQIPKETEISMDFVYLLRFYETEESMIADILLTDEETVRRTQTQKNDQISNDMLHRLWRFAVKILQKFENKRNDAKKEGKEVFFDEKEILLEKCATRLEKATDKEIRRRSMM
ncbi:MAG: hypothetical protein J6M60_04570 [Clostridia bacterium]|nr:hypothetical protein [Clostridia bacterium]